jgi:hypothetical protein
LQTLADLRRDIADEGLAGTEALGYIHALLPSLQLPTIQLLEATKLLEVLVFVVEIVKVELAHLIEASRELTPGALPFSISRLAAGSPLASTRANATAGFTSSGSSDLTARRRARRGSGTGSSRLGVELEEVRALHAVPVTSGNIVEANAVGVVGSIAAIAQQQHVFPLPRVADWTGIAIFLIFLGVLAKPLLCIEFGNLFLVFDFVCGNGGA